MTDSILDSTKKLLLVAETDASFDIDIIMHINTALSTLTQLGVGPDEGFAIEDASAKWVDFLGTDLRMTSAKSYVFLRVRMLFDPPTTSFLLSAFKEQVQELEWRLNVQSEHTKWVDPILQAPSPVSSDTIFDGGAP